MNLAKALQILTIVAGLGFTTWTLIDDPASKSGSSQEEVDAVRSDIEYDMTAHNQSDDLTRARQ
ncbi:MAG: hypothetical protein AAFY57_05360 [Cyanobacteria bacterium J06642_2]